MASLPLAVAKQRRVDLPQKDVHRNSIKLSCRAACQERKSCRRDLRPELSGPTLQRNCIKYVICDMICDNYIYVLKLNVLGI